MRLLQTGKAWTIEFSVAESRQLGLYDGKTLEGSRWRPQQRGLGTERKDDATALLTMLDAAMGASTKKPGAAQLVSDLVRTKTWSLAEALGAWQRAGEAVGFNATLQLDRVLAMRDRIPLAPLVAVWGGGDAAPDQQARNVAQLRRFIPAESAMTADEFTPRAIEAYLAGMLDTKTKYTGRRITKRTVIKHRSAISLFAQWLMSAAAANAAGLAVDRYILASNPLNHVQDAHVTQTRGDRKKWKKTRVWYTQPECQALVKALDGEARALAALLLGSCLEFGAVYNTRPLKGPVGPVLFKRNFLRDKAGALTWWIKVAGLANVDGDPTAAQLKTDDRTRRVEIPEVEGFEFYRRVVGAHLDTLREDDPFITQSPNYYTKRVRAALETLGLRVPGKLFHTFRHSFGQFWRDHGAATGTRSDGRDLDWLRNQLGHEDDSTETLGTYTENRRRRGTGEEVLDVATERRQRGIGLRLAK